MKKVLVLFMLLATAGEVHLLPRFAVRLGDKCSDCHVNPTGGIMRNLDGWYYGKNILSMISPREKDISLSPKLNDNISFGFDYRMQYLYSEEKNKTDFQQMTGAVYGNIVLSEKINVVAKYDFVQFQWEAYGIARILPNDSYIKVGTFQPNFGLRIDDHTAYTKGGDLGLLFATGIRQGNLYNPYYLETGVETGLNITDNFNATFSIGKSSLNGIFSKDPTYTARVEYLPVLGKLGLMFGGSYAEAKTPQPTTLYGGFGGFGYERFSLLGEYDIIEGYVNPSVNSNALMLEAAYELMVGLEAVIRYDRFDPNVDVSDDELAHLILGFEFFPYSFVELRPQYRIMTETPSVDNDSFVIQFHFWY